MTKKNFTVCGIPYEEYQVMKYNQLAKALEASKPAPKTYDEYLELCNEEYEAYCEQMEKENSDYFKQQDQNELPW